jgi:ParB-like chromosome segregation protein Spo0J
MPKHKNGVAAPPLPDVTLLKIEWRAPRDLSEYRRLERNPAHEQCCQIVPSIRKFGFSLPVLTNCGNSVIAGKSRVEAAKRWGLCAIHVPSLWLMTERERRAFVTAINLLADQAGWESDILAIELQHLSRVQLFADPVLAGLSRTCV